METLTIKELGVLKDLLWAESVKNNNYSKTIIQGILHKLDKKLIDLNTIKEKEPLFCNICGGENDEHSQDCTCYHSGIPNPW